MAPKLKLLSRQKRINTRQGTYAYKRFRKCKLEIKHKNNKKKVKFSHLPPELKVFLTAIFNSILQCFYVILNNSTH